MSSADRALQQALGYTFSDPGLLDQALSHRSAGARNYERLEFLGDGLLNLVIAEALFLQETDADEGDLSRLRARLVRESTLAEIANEIHVIPAMRLGAGERASAGHRRASIQADMVEALLGAILLDADFPTARRTVLHLFKGRLAALPDAQSLKDPKTRLQEQLQGDGHALPEYRVVDIAGPTHRQEFTCECALDAGRVFKGKGSSRRKAEQAAARSALAALAASSTSTEAQS